MSDGIKYRDVGQKKLEKEGFVGLTDLMKRMKGSGLMITSATRDKDHDDYDAKSSHSKGNAIDFGVKSGDGDSYMKFFFGDDANFKTNAENLTLTAEGKQYLVDHNAELLDERGMVAGGDKHGTHPHFHLEFNSPTDGVEPKDWEDSNFQDGTKTKVGSKAVTKWGVNNSYYKNDFQSSKDYSSVTQNYSDTIADSGSSSIPIGSGSEAMTYMTNVGKVKGYTWTNPKTPMNKEERLAYYKTYGGKLFTERQKRLESMEDWRSKGYFPTDNSGMTIGYGIDLKMINTVEDLVAHGINKGTAEQWEKLGILGKTKKELLKEGKKIGALKLQVYIPDTVAQKNDMAILTFKGIDETLKQYEGKISDDLYVSLSSQIHFNGGKGKISPKGFKSGPFERKSHASALVWQEIDNWIAENPDKPVPDKLVHRVYQDNAINLEANGSPSNATTYDRDAEKLYNDSVASNNYHLDRENVKTDYNYEEEGDRERLVELLRKEKSGSELTDEESDYLFNAQMNNSDLFYDADEESKLPEGVMTSRDVELLKKSKSDPDSLTEDEKARLLVIEEGDETVRTNLQVEATDEAVAVQDDTGGLGPAINQANAVAEEATELTGLVSGDSTEQDKELAIKAGEEAHKERIKKMLEDTDSYDEDGNLITQEQVEADEKAKADAEAKAKAAAESGKKEKRMHGAEVALTGLKAAAGLLSLSQALAEPDIDTPELSPLIYESLNKQAQLAKSGLTAKEKAAAMGNLNNAYAGAMKNVLRASGGQRGLYLANQGTVDANRIAGLNQLAAQDAALHRQNIQQYNQLASSVGQMKLQRDMGAEQMRQTTLANNKQILSGVGTNLLSDAISDVGYYLNPNRKATEAMTQRILEGNSYSGDGYENRYTDTPVGTASTRTAEQIAADKEAKKQQEKLEDK